MTTTAVEDEPDRRHAWECVCGRLNWGLVFVGAVCGSCRFEVKRGSQVEAQYSLQRWFWPPRIIR